MPAEGVLGDRGIADRAAERAGQPKPHPFKLRESHFSPLARALADLNGLARKRYRQAPRTLAEGWRLGGMLRVPPVVVGAVQLAEYLLRGLSGQVGQPRQVRTGIGEVAALLGRPDRASTLTPGEPALVSWR